MTRAILLIDHGSRRAEANAMLAQIAALVAEASGGLVVRHAHMELARPTIADGVLACVEAGATEIVAMPYMLSPGRHALEDIPRLVGEALEAHPEVSARVAPPLGVHRALAEVVLARVAESGD
jgi:sirohydrochlorin ferrochelatase